MYAITLHQPYASLIAAKVKREETRSRPPARAAVGQRIAIHAAKRRVAEIDLMDDPELQNACRDTFGYHYPKDLPLGAVVATAVIHYTFQVKVIDMSLNLVKGSSRDGGIWYWRDINAYGDFRVGRWIWVLRDIEPVDPPVPAKGRQGWWQWSP